MTPSDAFSFSTPDGLPDTSEYAFSQMAVVPPGRRLVFIAGQGAGDRGDFGAQVEAALANVETAIRSAGGTLASIAKVTILVVDFDRARHRTLTAALKRAWDGGPYPTSTLIPVPRLAGDGMLVEIEAVGVVLDDPAPVDPEAPAAG